MKPVPQAVLERTLSLRELKSDRLAKVLTLTSILVAILALGLSVWGVVTSGEYGSILTHQTLNPFITIAFAIIGAWIASHRPHNPIGWIFVSVGLLYSLTSLTSAISDYGTSYTQIYELAVWFSNWVWIPAIVLPVTFVLLIFPDGKLLSPRWRFVLWSAALGLGMTVLAVMVHPALLGEWDSNVVPTRSQAAPIMEMLASLGIALMVVGWVGSLAGFFVRFRRSDGILKEQMKWLAYAVGIMAFSFALSTVAHYLWPVSEAVYEISILATNLTVLGIAGAAAVAILRHHLYDINLIINRTLVYTALTAGVVALYGLVVGILGAVLQARGDFLLSLVATALVAILVQPMRDKAQRFVNHLMYGERDDPYALLLKLSRQLETSLSPEATLPRVVETVAQALKLPYVAIALRQEGDFKIAASYGLASDEWVQLPLIYQGGQVGLLRLSPRSPNETFTPGEWRLLEDIARHIGVTAHTVRLTQELRQLAEDLQRSREELVISREEERRRLRRDLHDELGPQLASLKLNLDVARNLVQRDPEGAQSLLVDLRTRAQDIITDIRRLVFDLRPPTLDELGLISAIQEYTRQIESQDGIHIRFDSPINVPPLPAAVDVAAYRITLEALANVVRHSQGKNCTISITLSEKTLRVEICDDGLGLPKDLQLGVGLNSMRERAAELGGTCVIEGLPRGGTRVLARLPLL